MKKEFTYYGYLYDFKADVNSCGVALVKNFVPYGYEDEPDNCDYMMDTRHTNGFIRLRIRLVEMGILQVEAETITLSQEPSSDAELASYCIALVDWLESR